MTKRTRIFIHIYIAVVTVFGILSLSTVAAAESCAEIFSRLEKALPTTCEEARGNWTDIKDCESSGPLTKAIMMRVRSKASMTCCGNAHANLDNLLSETSKDCRTIRQNFNKVEELRFCFKEFPKEQQIPFNDLEKSFNICLRNGRESTKRQTIASKPVDKKAIKGPLTSPSGLPEDGTDFELRRNFDEIRDSLDKTNQQISENECKETNVCKDLRKTQFLLLSLYLEFFWNTDVTNEKDMESALKLIGAIGLSPDTFTLVSGCVAGDKNRETKRCSFQQLKGAIGLIQILNNPDGMALEHIKYLAENREISKAQKDAVLKVVEALETGVNPVKIQTMINNLPPEAKSILYDAGAQVEERYADAGDVQIWKKDNEQTLSRLDIVVAEDTASDSCCEYTNVLKHGIWGGENAHPVHPAKQEQFEETIRKLVSKRSARCRFATPATEDKQTNQKGTSPTIGVGELGCGSIIGIQTEPTPGGKMSATVVLHFIRPGVNSQPIKISRPEFDIDPESQRREAEATLKSIRLKYDVIKYVGIIPPIENVQSQCGITLDQGLRPPVYPPPKAQGVSLSMNDLSKDSKELLLKSILQESIHSQQRLLGPVEGALNELYVQIRKDPGDSEDYYRIDFALRPSKGGKSYYEFTLFVDEKVKCAGDTIENRWRKAAVTAVDQLALYYYSIPMQVIGSMAGRLLLPGASWWTSNKGLKAPGIIWSISDLGLLTSGVLMLGLSINERNRFGQGEGSLDRSNRFQYIGYSLLGTFLLERIIWAVLPSLRVEKMEPVAPDKGD